MYYSEMNLRSFVRYTVGIALAGAGACVSDDAATPKPGVPDSGTTSSGGSGASDAGADGSAPQVVAINNRAISIAAGANQTCAVLNGGSVACWGANTWGQLGVDTASTPRSNVPVRVPGFGAPGEPSARQVAVGKEHTCVWAEQSTDAGTMGELWCFGNAKKGATGQAIDTDRALSKPVRVGGINVVRPKNASSVAKHVSAGGGFTCGTSGGDVASGFELVMKCFGQFEDGRVPGRGLGGVGGKQYIETPSVAVAESVEAIALANSFGCATSRGADTSAVLCWGTNESQQLGRDAGANPSADPTIVDGTANSVVGYAGVAAGDGHACAVSDEGDVLCWGTDGFGQTGQRAGLKVSAFGPTAKTSNARIVAAGGSSTCVLYGASLGGIKCFGANDSGQLGNQTQDTQPHAVPSEVKDDRGTNALVSAIDLAVGDKHVCAIVGDKSDSTSGKVFCWGRGEEGQLGSGTNALSTKPVLVP
jgi:alpha-tubulin suppressor-like RCC1 family protein